LRGTTAVSPHAGSGRGRGRPGQQPGLAAEVGPARAPGSHGRSGRGQLGIGLPFGSIAMSAHPDRLLGGFTLIEVLAVVLVTSLLLGAAINFYVNLSRQAAHASENTRGIRRTAALADRIAGDLEHAVLVKKAPDQDVLASPWLFVAESRYSQTGADRGS